MLLMSLMRSTPGFWMPGWCGGGIPGAEGTHPDRRVVRMSDMKEILSI